MKYCVLYSKDHNTYWIGKNYLTAYYPTYEALTSGYDQTPGSTYGVGDYLFLVFEAESDEEAISMCPEYLI